MPLDNMNDYYEAEHELLVAELQRCFTVSGECDGCIGRQRGCRKDCFEVRVDHPHLQIWDWLDIITFWNFPNYSPDGCTITTVKIAEPRFDIFERQQPPLIYADYQLFRTEQTDLFDEVSV